MTLAWPGASILVISLPQSAFLRSQLLNLTQLPLTFGLEVIFSSKEVFTKEPHYPKLSNHASLSPDNSLQLPSHPFFFYLGDFFWSFT
jgi:hypothetical protein